MLSMSCIEYKACVKVLSETAVLFVCVGDLLADRKSALTPHSPPPPAPSHVVVYSTDRSKAVVPVLVLIFVALWFILRGDLF